MAQATSKRDLSGSETSVTTQRDERESPAVFNYKKEIVKFLTNNLSMAMLRNFEERLELLRKSYFFITVLPRRILFDEQCNVQPVSISQILDPQRFKRMKKIGGDQTKMQLFLLQENLEQLQKGRTKLIELVRSDSRELSLAEEKTPIKYLPELAESIYNFRNLLVPGPLHIKHQLIPHVTIRHVSSLRLFLNNKGPVTFDRKESKACDNWALLSWHVSGQRHRTDSCELCFQQLNVPSNKVAHSGVYIVHHNSFKIQNLLPEKTYEFSIRRTVACNLVYSEWRDVMTMTTGEDSSFHKKGHACGDYKTPTTPRKVLHITD